MIWYTVICFIAVLSSGCSSDTKKWKVSLTATNALNPDESNVGRSVVLWYWQLRSKEAFDRADFKSLWESEQEWLKGDIVNRHELIIYPGDKKTLDMDIETKQGAKFLAFMALFRKPDADTWKIIVPAKGSALNPFTPKTRLILDRYSLKLNP